MRLCHLRSVYNFITMLFESWRTIVKNIDEELMLSIIVPTYNHEKYIIEALNSIKMQKTKYKYEVLVGEDKSTDNTKKILKQYEKDNPGFLTVFYRQENMAKAPLANSADLRHRAKGKYLITLEGDDFWLDELKLEKQISFLESHPDAVAVAHRCIVVDQDSKPNGEVYPECINEIYTIDDFAKDILPGQLTTIMSRNYIKDNKFDYSILEKHLSPGDRLLVYMLLCYGKVYCLNEKMSAYRHIIKGGSSYSANIRYKFEKDEQWWRELMVYAKKHGSVGIVYIEFKYLLTLLRGVRYKDINLKQFLERYMSITNKKKAVQSLFMTYILKK